VLVEMDFLVEMGFFRTAGSEVFKLALEFIVLSKPGRVQGLIELSRLVLFRGSCLRF